MCHRITQPSREGGCPTGLAFHASFLAIRRRRESLMLLSSKLEGHCTRQSECVSTRDSVPHNTEETDTGTHSSVVNVVFRSKHCARCRAPSAPILLFQRLKHNHTTASVTHKPAHCKQNTTTNFPSTHISVVSVVFRSKHCARCCAPSAPMLLLRRLKHNHTTASVTHKPAHNKQKHNTQTNTTHSLPPLTAVLSVSCFAPNTAPDAVLPQHRCCCGQD